MTRLQEIKERRSKLTGATRALQDFDWLISEVERLQKVCGVPAIRLVSDVRGCEDCDGFGIMTLMPQNIIAPCLGCSAEENLSDLEERKERLLTTTEEETGK